MDLNTFSRAAWTLDGGPYELAQHCLDNNTDVLLLLNAWLDSKQDIEEEHDWQTINYWAARLRPLWKRALHEISPNTEDAGSAHETTVIVSNRTGEENGALGIHAIVVVF